MPSTFEISQEDQKDRRSEGGKNAFFNSEDRIEKYSSEVQEQKTSLPIAGGSAKPQTLASVSSSRPPVLPVKKSRSCEVAQIRHVSFCEVGCELAAHHSNKMVGVGWLAEDAGAERLRQTLQL